MQQPFVEELDGGARRPRALWRLASQYALYWAIRLLMVNLLAVVWFAVGSPGLSSGGQGSAAGGWALSLIGTLAALVSALISAWAVGRFLDRRRFREFGLHLGGGWWLDLAFGLALGVLLMSGVFLVQLALGWVSVADTFESRISGAPFALAVLLPVGVFLCVGFYEELLSRGYQLTNLAEGLNHPALGPRGAVLAAWALTSVFFGALHAANPNVTALSIVNISLAGLLLGIGYVLTGHLAIPVGVHITWNLAQSTVYGFPTSGLGPIGASVLTLDRGGPELWTGGAFGPEGGLLVPAAILAGCALTILWVRLRYGRATVHAPLAQRPKASPARGMNE